MASDKKSRIQALKRRREAIGLTLKVLAKRMFVHERSVGGWENGSANPPHDFTITGWERTMDDFEQEHLAEIEAAKSNQKESA